MTIIRSTAIRVRGTGFSFASAFRDMTNAFACTKPKVRAQALDSTFLPPSSLKIGHKVFFEQRMVNPVVFLPSRVPSTKKNIPSDITLIPGAGNIIGSAEGPKMFIRSFDQYFSKYVEAAAPLAPTVTAEAPTGEAIRVDNVAFADDSASLKVVSDGKASTAAKALVADNLVFDALMSEGGWAQNLKKQEVVPTLPGIQGKMLQSALLHASKPPTCTCTNTNTELAAHQHTFPDTSRGQSFSASQAVELWTANSKAMWKGAHQELANVRQRIFGANKEKSITTPKG